MKNIRKIYDYIDCKDRFHRLYKNEKGSALLIAMIMIVVLLIIGTATMNTSTTEVMISGNYKAIKENFRYGEVNSEYPIGQSTIYSNIGISMGGSQAIPLAADNVPSANLGNIRILDNAAGTVTLRRCGNPARSMGDSEDRKMLYYHINVTATGPANAESQQFEEIGRSYASGECP